MRKTAITVLLASLALSCTSMTTEGAVGVKASTDLSGASPWSFGPGSGASSASRENGYFCRALGDSLTAGFIDKSANTTVSYTSYLQAMGSCSYVSNEGVAGQISTEIAVRAGAIPITATIVGGLIPALGSVGITFKSGYEPTTHYSTFGVPISVSGVAGISTHIGSSDVFTRSAPGMPVASSPDSPATVITGPMNSGFVIIWAGKNNANNPDQVLSDIAAIVDILPKPKKFLVLSVTNSNMPWQWRGGNQYDSYMKLDSSLAAAYPRNFLDIRAQLVAAYDQANPEDVIDHNHDVLPSSLRYFEDTTLTAPVPDTKSCTSIPFVGNAGGSVQIDQEKIYITNAARGFAREHGCMRGYAGTAAATHDAGAPVRTFDATHLNAAGQMFVAKQINAWMIANSSQLAR